MNQSVKILHIDPEFKVNYFIYRPGSSIRSSVSLPSAIALLKSEDFDLIISEPHNKAILRKKNPFSQNEPIPADNQIFREESHGYLGQVRSNSYS
jgi:hypothetical protein